MPLVAHDRPRGVLLVERYRGAAYDEDALRRLSIVSAQLGAYVAHCEAVAENRARSQEGDALRARDLVLGHRKPEQPLGPPGIATGEAPLIALAEIARLFQSADDAPTRLQRALELLRDVVPYDRCTLSCTQGEQTRFYGVPTPPRAEREEPVAALAALLLDEGDPDEKSDPAHRHLAMPIVAHGQPRGVPLVERHGGAPYDEDALRRLSIVSAQLGAYVAHCEVVDALRARGIREPSERRVPSRR